MTLASFQIDQDLDDRSVVASGQHVRIVIPDHPVMRELGAMLLDELRRAGHEPFLHLDADRELLDADRVILVGHCLRDPRLRDLLRDRNGGGPRVIVWQTEPLPPPGLTPLGEDVGRRVVGWSWSRLPAPIRRSLEPVVPFRTRLLEGVQWCSARRYRKAVNDDPDRHGWGEFSIPRFRKVMSTFIDLRDAVADGVVDHVVASTPSRHELLTRFSVPSSFCPVGHHEIWGRRLDVRRDIDVLFLGTLSRRDSRRTMLLRSVQAALSEAGRELRIVSEGCFGHDRERLLNRCRIVLDLPRIPWEFPIMRMLMAMGCGALVVSEQSASPDPFVEGEHFIGATRGDLVDRILCHLDRESQRAEIAERGRRFVTGELAMTRWIPKLIFPELATTERQRA